LSQKDPKRPGSRDISELKARLGLKQKGAAAGTGTQSRPNGGGVVPPPGLNLPPPPGARPPGPVIPNAADDPFGAMNAMAQYGAAQRAPEIVVVNDGRPVEQVGSSDRWIRIGIYAAVAIVPLIVGWLVGGAGQKAAFTNQSTERAQKLQGEVDRITKKLGTIRAAFEANAAELRGRERPVGEDLTRQLKAVQDEHLVARRSQAFGTVHHLQGAVELLEFYSLLQEVDDLVTEHVTRAALEEPAIATGNKVLETFGVKPGEFLERGGSPYKVGLLLSNPTGEDGLSQGARLVEIGQPLCGHDIKTASEGKDGKCSEDQGLAGFAYRLGTGPWQPGKILLEGIKPGDKWPNDVLWLLTPTDTFKALVETSSATLAQAAYFERLVKIFEKVRKANEKGEELRDKLNVRARAGKKFTWFQ
jgi:hypothetical protein